MKTPSQVAQWLARGQPPARAVWQGKLLQTSGVAGIDLRSGCVPTHPAEQFELAFENLRRLLEAAGARMAEVALVNVFVPSRAYREYINGPWLKLFPGPERPARKTNTAPLPEGLVVQLQATAVRADGQSIEIPNLAHRDPLPAGCRAGDWLFSSVIAGESPLDGVMPANPRAQMDNVFTNVRRLMEQAGGSLSGVNHLWVFLRDFAAAPDMLTAYLEAFPEEGDRPARKSLLYPLPEGVHVQVQFTGATGARRINYEVPGIAHHDPIPLASSVGGLLHSSGMYGLDPATSDLVTGGVEPETAMTLDNIARLMRTAGGDLSDIASLTVLVRRLEDAPLVHRQLVDRFQGGAFVPPLQFVRYALPGDLQVQMLLTARLPERSTRT